MCIGRYQFVNMRAHSRPLEALLWRVDERCVGLGGRAGVVVVGVGVGLGAFGFSRHLRRLAGLAGTAWRGWRAGGPKLCGRVDADAGRECVKIDGDGGGNRKDGSMWLKANFAAHRDPEYHTSPKLTTHLSSPRLARSLLSPRHPRIPSQRTRGRPASPARPTSSAVLFPSQLTARHSRRRDRPGLPTLRREGIYTRSRQHRARLP
ncbi:hypothetical protein EDC01DRAFT_746836 [Geopyxis carbonaria]|nr:hypothetical protein EDC01DRAFT_746836 [Geopyxis carbonaria]